MSNLISLRVFHALTMLIAAIASGCGGDPLTTYGGTPGALTATNAGAGCASSAAGTQQAPVGDYRPITANEIWTAAASPHRGGTLYVENGAVLTIEAGATVCVEAIYMENGGRLDARGRADAHVLFTLADP